MVQVTVQVGLVMVDPTEALLEAIAEVLVEEVVTQDVANFSLFLKPLKNNTGEVSDYLTTPLSF